MKTEVGVITAHPLTYAWIQVKMVLKTWIYCKRNGLPCDKWFGVFKKD